MFFKKRTYCKHPFKLNNKYELFNVQITNLQFFVVTIIVVVEKSKQEQILHIERKYMFCVNVFHLFVCIMCVIYIYI